MTMHLFDPTRPKLGNGSPCLLTGGASPTLYLVPLAKGQWRIMVFLLAHGTSYRPRHIDVLWSQVAPMLSSWEADPELCCKKWFNYTGPEAPPEASPKASSKQSAHDWLVERGLIPKPEDDGA